MIHGMNAYAAIQHSDLLAVCMHVTAVKRLSKNKYKPDHVHQQVSTLTDKQCVWLVLLKGTSAVLAAWLQMTSLPTKRTLKA